MNSPENLESPETQDELTPEELTPDMPLKPALARRPKSRDNKFAEALLALGYAFDDTGHHVDGREFLARLETPDSDELRLELAKLGCHLVGDPTNPFSTCIVNGLRDAAP